MLRFALLLLMGSSAFAQDRVARLPGVEVDVEGREVRVAAEALRVEMPLEFIAVVAGTSDHEALLRTAAKPSDIHTGLLMLGLQPGTPLTYSAATETWTPPRGPPMNVSVRWTDDAGTPHDQPVHRLIRAVEKHTPMPRTHFVFAGSRVLDDGRYAADLAGYVISLVNFDFTLLDVPQIASSDNASLMWEVDPETSPAHGTPVTIVLRPLEDSPQAAAAAADQTLLTGLSLPVADAQKLAQLRLRWESAVTPNAAALREAAQTHYDVIRQLREEQQRLIDEADDVGRLIDELDEKYAAATTPRPSPTTAPTR